MFSLEAAQSFLRQAKIDAWLVYDFRGSNPVFRHLLDQSRAATRRAFLVIRPEGEPMLLTHPVDQAAFRTVSCPRRFYRGWLEMRATLKELLGEVRVLALEYSSEGSLPAAASVDAGTVELLRSWGYEIVSSADLFQVSAAAWDDAALESHRRASTLVAEVKDAAFDHVRGAIRHGRTVSEYELQQYILAGFAARGLETTDVPIVQVNGHSGDLYYEPAAEFSAQIGRGDWLLIDIWARLPGRQNVFADIAWVAFGGEEAPAHHRAIFEIVREARDRAVGHLQACWARGAALQGWQVDEVARGHIAAAGYGENFLHRTGHSLGPGERLHGLGVNIDNLETKDTRLILPRLGFSIEPGIYLPEFGVRLEINVYVDPVIGPTVTTPSQDEIVLLV
ncbi:MAG TPA: M24 family metallopeptidase [Dongiaceae bacterium]|nr:M24 family metallopeptidase [Dongiaceae bacterium]